MKHRKQVFLCTLPCMSILSFTHTLISKCSFISYSLFINLLFMPIHRLISEKSLCLHMYWFCLFFKTLEDIFLKPCRKFKIIPQQPCTPLFQHKGFFSDNFLCIFTFRQIISHQSKSYFWSITYLSKQYNSQDLPHGKNIQNFE